MVQAATGAVFECYLQRVRHHGERAQLASDADTQAGREALAGVLVSNLQVPGGNTEVRLPTPDGASCGTD